jgi:hypothetical protein
MITVPKGPSTPATGSVTLLIATRKDAWFQGQQRPPGVGGRRASLPGPHVHSIVPDPRDQSTLLLAAHAGHYGPTVFRSTDDGKTRIGLRISFLNSCQLVSSSGDFIGRRVEKRRG